MNAPKAMSLKTKLSVLLSLAALTLLSGLSMRVDAATTSYTYDSLNRLTQTTYSDGSVIKYTYDKAGNRLLQSITAPYTISVSASPLAGGTVIGGGAYASGASATVTATANSGYTFKNWTDGATIVSTSLSYSFTVTASRTLVANFTTSYTISVSASPSAGGTVSGGGTYPSGATATVTATAKSGYTFTNWTEGTTIVSTSLSYSFTVTGNRTLVANFTANATSYTISVSASPSAGGTVSGGGPYPSAGTATVTATANGGYTFKNWTEGTTIVSSSFSYSFTVTGNRTLVANFTANTYIISVSASPSAGGTVSGGGTHSYNSTATVTAVANSGYFFTDWTEGGVSVSTSLSYSFTVTQSRTLVANFSTGSGSLPNLTPFKPSTPNAWSDKIVVSTVSGSYTDALILSPTDTLYVDWAVINNGSAAVTSTFYTQLYVDGILKTTWTTSLSPSSPLSVNSWVHLAPGYNIGSLSAGTHTLKLVTDSTNAIVESNESDNQYTKTIAVGPNLTPYKPSGWSDKIVVSTVTGTHTDALYLSPTNTLYVDWAASNTGSPISVTFYSQLWVDGVLKATWYTPPPLNSNYYVYVPDYNMGTLSVGTHTLKIVIDSTNAVAESNENDNQYTKTIVVGPNRTDFNSDGKSDYLLLDAYGNTKVSYLNGATLLSTVTGPTITTGWQLASVNDFDGNGKPDFVLFNPSTLQTQIWYLNGVTYVSSAAGPTLPSGWVLRATADFNQDGKPDYLLVDTTGNTRVYYLNGTVISSSVDGPPLTAGWILVSANDFNGDGKPEYLLFNPTTLETKIWTITSFNGTSSTYTSAAGPVIPSGWQLRSALGDYNRDKKPDWLLWNPITFQTQIWYMNGVTKLGSATGPTLPTGFSVFGR